jgi:hypothetical protein
MNASNRTAQFLKILLRTGRVTRKIARAWLEFAGGVG